MKTYTAVDLNFQRQNKCGSNQLGNDFWLKKYEKIIETEEYITPFS